MQYPQKRSTMVQPGHRIEVTAPEFKEGSRVDLFIFDPSAQPLRTYPSVLECEYDVFTSKQLHGALTNAESIRLQSICSVINEIDRLTNARFIHDERLEEIETKLDLIRKEIESLRWQI